MERERWMGLRISTALTCRGCRGITYLRTLPGDERIVEAEGGTIRITRGFHRSPGFLQLSVCHSTNSCGGVMIPAGSVRDWLMYKSIYEEPEKTYPLMKKYNATLLYVGDAERERYEVNISATNLEKIYSADGTEIYRLSG